MSLILVYDDEDTVGMSTGRMLERFGHTVEVCESATDADMLMRSGRYDAGVFDGSNHGWEICSQLKADGYNVIMLSANYPPSTPWPVTAYLKPASLKEGIPALLADLGLKNTR